VGCKTEQGRSGINLFLMSKIIDLTGQVFGELLVMDIFKRDRYGIYWSCECSCGKFTIVRGSHLRQGKTGSCGCKQGNHLPVIKHGHAMGRDKKASPEYYTWLAMMARCRNPKTKHYRLYGGRGITVCERWLKFENFLLDMGLRPSDKYSLDRYPNKDGNYEPGNCRWATIFEQNSNKNNNVFYEHEGRKQILEDWARELNADPGNIGKRIKAGQSFSDIYNHYKNVKKRNRRVAV